MSSAAFFRREPKTSTRPTAVTEEMKKQERTRGEDAVPAPGHTKVHVPDDYRMINGWGADLDPADRPAVPRELPSNVLTARGDVKHWQTPHTKIHVSNEHPGLTPVFGEAQPSHGLSGLLRDYAYQYGEATNRHWMTLMMANRVDVLECLVRDLFRGKPDNIPREKGWGARLKYEEGDERKRVVMIGAGVLGALALGILVTRALREE